MSHTEHKVGQLVPIDFDGTIEEKCKHVVTELTVFKKEAYHHSYKDVLEDGGYRAYYIGDNEVYQIVNNESFEDDTSIFKAVQNNDGTIDYEVRFYNGGCGFNEALDYAMKNKVDSLTSSAEDIISFFSDRVGFDDWFANIDKDIQQKLISELQEFLDS